MPEVSVNTLVVNDAVLFTPPGGVEDVFVLTVVDPSKNIYTAIQASNKSIYNFKPDDMVQNIGVPGLGLVLLAL